jgi:hypothetical protein
VSTINPGVTGRRSGGSSTLKQFRADNHISERTWKRLKAAGDIPRITWITSRKGIIRDEHGREWLDRRTDPAPDASPFLTDGGAS